MRILKYTAVIAAIFSVSVLNAQESDKKDVRRGNRRFKDNEFKEAVVDYQKALLRDSTSFAASYNLANAIYRLDNAAESKKILDSLSDQAQTSAYASDYYYNLGNTAVAQKDWQAAVEAYKQSLLRNPGDLDAKENYIYAKKKLEDQQNQDQNQDQNKDRNKDNQDKDQNQDQDKDQNKDQDQDQNQDQNQDQDKDPDQNNPDQKQNPDQNRQNPQQKPAMTKQAAQQMLNAIMAKEKETQDKVNKEKAAVLKSKQKEKNW